MMRVNKPLILLTLTLFLLFGGANIHAAMPTGSFSLNPSIGGCLFEGDQELDHGPAYGLGLSYQFCEQWETEAVLNYIDTESDRAGRGDVDGFLYRLDGMYHFMSSNKLAPYLAAGIGGITLEPDRGDSDSGFLFNYGAGLKYMLTDTIALRGDVRHLLTFPDNNLLYTVGFNYIFGGKKKEVAVVRDSDGDGIYDDQDQCPGTPFGVKVDVYGCPLDSDGDGVLDYLDQCPGTPKGVLVDKTGCPLDSDGDGVYDNLDQCPGTPKGATVDHRGCWVLKDVTFDTAKWDIKPEFFNKLDEVATILQKNPSLAIEIQGHTDNLGTAGFNQMLSEKRAKEVMEYLMEKNIEQNRLSCAGYGFSKPAASNETPEGRAKNRRVQLKPIR